MKKIAINSLWILLVLTSGLFAQPEIVGFGGEVYEIHLGPRSDFENNGGPNAGHWVMALEVIEASGQSEFIIVPGTEDELAETNPAIDWDDTRGRLLISWISERQSGYGLHVVEYGREDFVPIFSEYNDRYDFSRSPVRFWTHSKSIREQRFGQQSVLHLFWRDDIGRTYYNPLVTVDGVYFGNSSLMEITGLFQRIESPKPYLSFLTPKLWSSRGDDGEILLVVADPLEGRLSTVKVKMVPEELVGLADLGRAIIIHGGGTGDPEVAFGNLVPELSDYAGLHPSILGGIFQNLLGEFEGYPGYPNYEPHQLADLARGIIITGGITADDGGVLREFDPEQTVILETTDDLDLEKPSHFFEVTVIREFSLPDIPEDAEVFVSSQGDHLAVAWPANGGVAWIKDSGDGWVHNLMIPVGFGLTQEEAFRLIERQTRHR